MKQPYTEPDRGNGTLRLFGQGEDQVRMPYCQKVWLWLERIKKVTMFCYGEEEAWYKAIVPSGMLPAVELDGRLITESDDILLALEKAFGPLSVTTLRRLERSLFRAWCQWLCYPSRSEQEEEYHRSLFLAVVDQVEAALAQSSSPFFLSEFSVVDIIFVPYVERMHASLFYYKGYELRRSNPRLSQWFDALETRSTYRHTHAHDLPPQMRINQTLVDRGDHPRPCPMGSSLSHHNLIKVNPFPEFDYALNLVHDRWDWVPPGGSELGLRYLRDMGIYSAKYLRQALENTAKLVTLPVKHRRDQDPRNFVGVEP